MKYTLMHKNIEVAELIIAESAVAITDIGTIHNPEHIPPGVLDLKGKVDIGELNDWLKGRSIPASRSGVWDLYTRLGRSSTEYLILKCYGLSLSDHYWIRPAGSGLIWDNINFFQNDFSRDVGEMLFGREPADKKNINLVSPDNTSDGWLRKKWIIADGKRMLVKGSSEPWKQEPFNEVIACAVMRRLGIAHVPYSMMFEDSEPYCLCENFLSVDTELIPAWKVLHSSVMTDGDSDFTHLMRCCEQLGIPNVRAAIDKMITLDYIIVNEDRHYTNFGFVRNAETLVWHGTAPIFDCGTSLWHNAQKVGEPRKCQKKKKTHEEQIKLVS
ncbi:MAG: excisionase, partial [Oscillospiraceae bacterium]|nr:excisionase [Oscillospiraceae bacterium]